MPCGAVPPITPSWKPPSLADRHVFDRAIQRRHAAGDRPAFEGRAGGTGCRQNAVPVAQDQLGVGADVHDRDQAVFVREIDRQHAGRRVRAHVSADDRRAVDARLRMDRQQASPAGGRQAGGGPLALGHFDFRDRAVRILPDRIDALAEEQIAHGGVAHHHHLVDGPRIDREVLRWRASGSRPGCASTGRDARRRS